MDIYIDPAVPAELVSLARCIAKERGYPVLVQGVQPLEDYDLNGVRQPGLRSKLAHERDDELHECLCLLKARIWWLSEAADCLYYAACIDAVSPHPEHAFARMIQALADPYGIAQEEAEAASLAKYRLRAATPYRKDKATREEKQARDEAENAAIQAALDELPWPGMAIADMAERYAIPEQTLYKAVRSKKANLPVRRTGSTILINPRDARWHAWLLAYKREKEH